MLFYRKKKIDIEVLCVGFFLMKTRFNEIGTQCFLDHNSIFFFLVRFFFIFLV